MKKRHALIAAAAAALMLITFSPAPAYAEPDSLEEVEEELDEKGRELEQVTEKYNGAREDLKDTKERIEEIEESLPELEDEAEESREQLGKIASEVYTSGHDLNSAAAVLADSPDIALDRMTALGAINASQASDAANHSETVAGLEEELDSLEDLRKDQKDTEKGIEEQKDEIEGEVSELEQLEAQYGNGGGGGGLDGAPPPPSGDAGAVVQFAYDQVGKPYDYGSAGPNGYDCSGLTLASWSQAGVSLSHQASRQREETANVSAGELSPGDLVFYYGDLHHVALYVGDGKVVHAPQAGQNVSVASVNDMPVHSYGRPG